MRTPAMDDSLRVPSSRICHQSHHHCITARARSQQLENEREICFVCLHLSVIVCLSLLTTEALVGKGGRGGGESAIRACGTPAVPTRWGRTHERDGRGNARPGGLRTALAWGAHGGEGAAEKEAAPRRFLLGSSARAELGSRCPVRSRAPRRWLPRRWRPGADSSPTSRP